MEKRAIDKMKKFIEGFIQNYIKPHIEAADE